MPEKLNVLLVEPNKTPRQVEIPHTLESLQEAVGGYIEAAYPYGDMVGIICNEEGKINQLPLNRAIYGEDKQMIDIIAGPFLVVGLSDNDFASLSPDLLEKYRRQFYYPEGFMRTPQNKVMAYKIKNIKPKGKVDLDL